MLIGEVRARRCRRASTAAGREEEDGCEEAHNEHASHANADSEGEKDDGDALTLI